MSAAAAELFAGGGETGALMARLDWAATPVGPVAGWPQSLRAAVRLVLSSRYPMLLIWGPQFTQLYNDAYSALIGAKHPAALGSDVRVTLAEGWDVLGPIIDEAVTTGVASWVPALRLRLDRAGYPEEAYFSVSHAGARDDDGATVGVFTVCSEVTEQVVGERRLRLLRDLSVRGGQIRTVQRACDELMETVAGHRLDVPFAAVYLREGALLRRMASVGPHPDGPAGNPVDAALPTTVSLTEGGPADPWSLRRAGAGEATAVGDVTSRMMLPAGPWGEPVGVALALPLPSAERDQPLGVLLCGVSPSRHLDEAYRSFFELLGQQVSVAVRHARAYEQERQRAEALAELDRVKTGFFTNVSHEFRTPLTLMLGPLGDALADTEDPLSQGQRDRVDTARRNATRLLKLVNNLLTFASLQAGRAPRSVQQVELSAITTEITGVFRAAVERAGLRLVVHCPPLPRPVALDPGHWETIVANLLSNALKFTFVGEIRVALHADDTAVRLTVADTGIGIAPQERARLFERFHRVQGVRSRSHEGTGIGLALVQELTRLQGGEVDVASEVGAGTTFTVVLPWSSLPPTAAPDTASAAAGDTARAAAQEALQWLAADVPADTDPWPEPPPDERGGDPTDEDPLRGARVLVADDNADMRAYLTRLLTRQGWQVQAVPDGQTALDVLRRHRPDLLLTDVMMPRLDGFQLVRAVRRDEATRALPIVVLSARAGREASVEGLGLGADDYVVKPFSANELVARLRSTMRLARARGAAPRPAPVPGTAALIAAGQALEAAVRLLTAQARALLSGAQALTVLTGASDVSGLQVAVPADAAVDPHAAAVSVPVADGPGRQHGTLTVRAGARPLDPAGRDRLLPVAQMLAVVAGGAWQPGEQPDIASAVQRSVLPQRLPDIAGWELAARYAPARAGADGDAGVGGDWYDVHPLPDGRVLLGIGDVVGRGLAAVSLIGHLRHGLRSSAVRGEAPAQVLLQLADLLHRLDPAALATVLVGYLDPAAGALHWCSAGHPAPVRVRPGLPARWLTGGCAAPLGLLTEPPQTHHATLEPGAVLLLGSDVLIEDGPGGELRATGPSVAAPDSAAVSDIVDAVLAGTPDRYGDLALLALRRGAPVPAAAATPVSDVDESWVYPADRFAAAAMRRDLRRALAVANVDDDLVFELSVAASEALNNAVEHAQRPTRPEVAVRLTVGNGVVRVTVQDFGSWRGRQPAMDRGRGAALMSAYAQVRVESGTGGTTVVIERAIPGGR